MSGLSNLIARHDPPGWISRPVRSDEFDVALRLILADDHGRASDEASRNFLQYAEGRGIDLRAIRVLERGGRIVWAVLPTPPSAGSCLLLAPPTAPKGISPDDAGAFVRGVVEPFAGQGISLVQLLLSPGVAKCMQIWLAAGFVRIAELFYLHRVIRPRDASRAAVLPAGLSLACYSDPLRCRFERVLEATYQQSLDCPAFAAFRTAPEALEAHKAAGEFDPGLWFLLSSGTEDLALLLLARNSNSLAMELVYLGVTPAARGRGLGRVLLQHAIHVTACCGLTSLVLAVDRSNTPAVRLYLEQGMIRTMSRIALARRLAPAPSDPSDSQGR
jgi:GNAT superfamily N-acetyltransferase